MTGIDPFEHVYTPHGLRETANTLGAHQVGGLKSLADAEGNYPHINMFLAQHLLEAGYVIVYAPDRAQTILDRAGRMGELT